MPFTAIWVDLKSVVLSKSDTERQITWYHFYGDSNGALFQPRGVGWGERWEGGSQGRGYMYTYGWFMLRFGRKQHNSVKQLSFKKKIKKRRHAGSVVSDSFLPLKFSRLLCLWDSPGKNTGVGCYFLLQGIFPTQGSNPHLLHLLHWHLDSLLLCHVGSTNPSPKKKVQMNSFTKQQFWTDPRSETEPASLALEGGFSTAGPPGKFHGLRF